MTDSHMPYRSHAVPLPYHEYIVMKVTSQDNGRVAAWEQHGNGMVCVIYHRPSRDGIWATCPRSASSAYHAEFQEGCYHKHTDLRCRWSAWNQATFVIVEEMLIIMVQGHECLYNVQHKYYDNNLAKDNCWKEIAGEWQGSGRVVAGSRQGNGMRMAWERHGICESALSHPISTSEIIIT
jgi:hypothetical protein